MSEILELLDKVNGMSFSEIEIEVEGINLKIKRQLKEAKAVLRNSPNSIEEFGGFSTAKEVKAPGLASSGQVKYARDLLRKILQRRRPRVYGLPCSHSRNTISRK